MFNFALMNLTTKQIAEEINGTVEGDTEIQISQLSKIEEGENGSISFLANPKYTEYIYSTKASSDRSFIINFSSGKLYKSN